MASELIGQNIGPYTLLEQIGVGGMGAVYRAIVPGRSDYLAVKVIGQSVADDPDYRHRFQREARVASQLDHPNILPVLDFGEIDGILYIAMPFANFGTLGDYLSYAGVMTPRETAQVAVQIGAALDYAHSQGVIHRDVKPENIMLMGHDLLCLSDFGLAKRTSAASVATTQLTMAGNIIGTPSYMSPEQAMGMRLDGRSDLYSLGVVLYRCLLGRLPFQSDSPLAMVALQISAMPLAPHAINPDFPPALGTVLLKALAKDPNSRFQTASELVVAFTDALTSLPAGLKGQAVVTPEQIEASVQLSGPALTPLVAPVINVEVQPTRPALVQQRRRRWMLGLAAVLLLVLLLGVGQMALIGPIQQRALHAEQTAEALLLRTPIVITQLVMVTNEAGQPVYIEVTRMVTGEPAEGQPALGSEPTRQAATAPASAPIVWPTLTPSPTLAVPSASPGQPPPGGGSEPTPTSPPAIIPTATSSPTPTPTVVVPPTPTAKPTHAPPGQVRTPTPGLVDPPTAVPTAAPVEPTVAPAEPTAAPPAQAHTPPGQAAEGPPGQNKDK